MKHIDEPRLESDAVYRVSYVSEFMGFGPEDVSAIHGAAPHLAPLVPLLVDAVYDKLFSYDATKRHFVPRQSGYTGSVPESMDDCRTGVADVYSRSTTIEKPTPPAAQTVISPRFRPRRRSS